MRFPAYSVFCVFFSLICGSPPQGDHDCETYSVGDKITIECKDLESGEWGPGPKCQQTAQELSFQFGVDAFQSCNWEVPSVSKYQQLRSLLERDEKIFCRIAVAPKHEFFVPFTIPLWGILESDHFHVGTHLNFVFHAKTGKILGVSCYPVRDRFQFVKDGTIIHLHGPVKWFGDHSFKDFLATERGLIFLNAHIYLCLWCLISFLGASVLFNYIYKKHLRPHVLRSVLKND